MTRATLRKLITLCCCVVLIPTAGCAFQGINSLPLPGAVGRGPDARSITSRSPMSVRWNLTPRS